MSDIVKIEIGTSLDDYRTFLKCKKLPRYQVEGRTITTDSVSYATIFGGDTKSIQSINSGHLLDFQKMIVNMALRQKRFAALLDCGLGKTPIALEYAHSIPGKVLILCPLSVYEQFQIECLRWYGHRMIDLRYGEKWNNGIAIMNFEGRKNIDMTDVNGVVLDEASILKNDTGATMQYLSDLVRNVEYRMTCSATPAPNDHSEYASQAYFLGLVQSTKEFFAKFFRKDGPRWILKGHAEGPFYEYLSTWAIYIKSPSSLGFDGKTEMPCEPEYIFKKCETQKDFFGKTNELFPSASNNKNLPEILGKLRCNPDSDRFLSILEWIKGKKTIIWTARNAEESILKKHIEKSIVVNGSMPVEKRIQKIEEWKNGEIDHLISKPSVLGFGVNLPECERMVFSGFTYSFEQFYQAVRRAHRYGRNDRLKVLIPYTWPELHILDSIRRKMKTFEHDTTEIQKRFKIKEIS